MDSNGKQPLLVTTAHRGVFFGYGVPAKAPTIRLERVRMCVYWPRENRSVVGLAADGPMPGARIGPAADAMTLRDVTGVVEVSLDAAARFEEAPWD